MECLREGRAYAPSARPSAAPRAPAYAARSARRDAPRRPEARQPRQGALPARRHHQARHLGLLHGDRARDAARTSPGGRSRCSAIPTGSTARSGTSRTRPRRRPTSCASSTRARATTTRSASSATTSRRCSGSRTSRRSRSTSGAATCRRGDDAARPSTTRSRSPTTSCSISIRATARGRTSSRWRDAVRTLLDALKLESFVKTSGKRGRAHRRADRARARRTTRRRRSPSRSRARWPRCCRRSRRSSA